MDAAHLPSTVDCPRPRAAAAPAFAPRTPGMPLGPFYPLRRAADASASLSGDEDEAAVPLRLSGRVLSSGGAAVAGALVEIWQADEHGGYVHASAPPSPLPSGVFTGYGATRTDGSGRYAFRTRRPGPYGDGDGGGTRAPHVHVQVSGAHDRVVSQMFFEGDPSNGADRWLSTVRNPQRLFGRVVSAPGAAVLEVEWDIVLATG